jgi:hypothetical protein
MATKNRPDKNEFNKRLLNIQSWIIDNLPTTIIIQQILMKEWAKSERHAYILVEKARKEWLKYEYTNMEEKRQLAVQTLKRRMYGMSNEYKNTPQGLNTMLKYEKEINRLEGLDSAIKIELSGRGGSPLEHEVKHIIQFEDYAADSTEIQ